MLTRKTTNTGASIGGGRSATSLESLKGSSGNVAGAVAEEEGFQEDGRTLTAAAAGEEEEEGLFSGSVDEDEDGGDEEDAEAVVDELFAVRDGGLKKVRSDSVGSHTHLASWSGKASSVPLWETLQSHRPHTPASTEGNDRVMGEEAALDTDGPVEDFLRHSKSLPAMDPTLNVTWCSPQLRNRIALSRSLGGMDLSPLDPRLATNWLGEFNASDGARSSSSIAASDVHVVQDGCLDVGEYPAEEADADLRGPRAYASQGSKQRLHPTDSTTHPHAEMDEATMLTLFPNAVGAIALPLSVCGPVRIDGRLTWIPLVTWNPRAVSMVSNGLRLLMHASVRSRALSGAKERVPSGTSEWLRLFQRSALLSAPLYETIDFICDWVSNANNNALLKNIFLQGEEDLQSDVVVKALPVSLLSCKLTVRFSFALKRGAEEGSNFMDCASKGMTGLQALVAALLEQFPDAGLQVDRMDGDCAYPSLAGDGSSVAVEGRLSAHSLRSAGDCSLAQFAKSHHILGGSRTSTAFPQILTLQTLCIVEALAAALTALGQSPELCGRQVSGELEVWHDDSKASVPAFAEGLTLSLKMPALHIPEPTPLNRSCRTCFQMITSRQRHPNVDLEQEGNFPEDDVQELYDASFPAKVLAVVALAAHIAFVTEFATGDLVSSMFTDQGNEYLQGSEEESNPNDFPSSASDQQQHGVNEG